jgi:hypothetical protein
MMMLVVEGYSHFSKEASPQLASGSERIIQCWINGSANGGIDDKINPPAAHHYSISGVNSESSKNIYIISRL